MMNDLWTMIWKEVKDEILQGGRQVWIRPLMVMAIVGIILPWKIGPAWLMFDTVVIPLALYLSFFNIISYIGDAIAGEHERHTLETLLASRIPDRAILMGKVIVTVGYNWSLVLASLMLGWVVVNVTKGAGTWTFYAPVGLLIYTLVLSLLTSLLAASSGVLVSLHSPTVRQAQQTLLLSTLALGVVLFFGLKAVPAEFLASLNTNQILLIILAVLVVLDAILLGIALASFKRARLILS
jgi:ABC-2 type transport system permease protein